MLTYETIVSLVFRFIDLCIIIGLAWYLFKHWASPFFKKEMDAEKKRKQDLIDQIDNSMSQADNLDKLLLDDKKRVEHLKEQIMQWRFVHEQKLREHQQQKKIIAAELQVYYNQRMESIVKNSLYKKMFPIILDQAEQELEHMFQDKQKGYAFIETTLKKVAKDNP